MRFSPTALPGVMVVDVEPHADERGFFARVFDRNELAANGLETDFAQQSISFNKVTGTLRGLHYQAEPFGEVKLIRCTAGAIWDVAVDIRPDSATFRRWTAVELSAANHRALFIPRGFAHGFITLQEASEVLYLISAPYEAAAARVISWNDPSVAIAWPRLPAVMSERDASAAPLRV